MKIKSIVFAFLLLHLFRCLIRLLYVGVTLCGVTLHAMNIFFAGLIFFLLVYQLTFFDLFMEHFPRSLCYLWFKMMVLLLFLSLSGSFSFEFGTKCFYIHRKHSIYIIAHFYCLFFSFLKLIRSTQTDSIYLVIVNTIFGWLFF